MPQSEGGYKKFSLEKLFKSANGNFDIQKTHYNGKGVVVVSAGESNNGIVGKTDVSATIFPENTITVDMFGNSYYQSQPYKMVTHARVFSLSPINEMKMSREIGLYIVAHLHFLKHLFSYNNMCSWEKIRQLTIELPVDKLGNIDFDAIKDYVHRIEQERINKIETYLQTFGFDDCTLTLAEKAALDKIQKGALSYKPFKISDLFTQYRGKEKAPNQVKAGSVPMINETSTNNGLTKMATPTRIFEGNAITISINYATTVFYQPYDFCASVNISILKNDDILTEQTALYFAALLQKNNQRYDYSHKISKDKINDTILSLPVTADGSIDYAFMENYINAIKKQTIARVKEYIDSEYKTEEQLLEEEQPTITPLRIHDTYQPGRIPLYTLRAACGYFDEGQLPEEEGWIDASGLGFTPDPKRHFAVHAKGDSMLPKIIDGDLCIFEWYTAGSREGEIVLTQSSEYDSEYGGRYTIKRYHSEKTVTDEGWQHASVQLLPLNKDYEPIELDEFGEYRTIGIFKCVLN